MPDPHDPPRLSLARRLGPARLIVLLVLIVAIGVMTWLNLDAWRGRMTPATPPAGFDPMLYDPAQHPAGDPTIDALLRGSGQPLDQEPAGLDPFPDAQRIDRFGRSSGLTREAVSVHRLPAGATLDEAQAHYRPAAETAGFALLTIDRRSDRQSRRVTTIWQDSDGRVLTIRLAPRAPDEALHATVWLRYAMAPDSPTP
ncbi:MAG: hypothetical protein GVY24_03465 [Planctomycetes bacterium]|jgi:hypothetical protein|nr:hypothetical protein [Planctomycetota bacterium]